MVSATACTTPIPAAGSTDSPASRQDGLLEVSTRDGTARRIRKLASPPSHSATIDRNVVLAMSANSDARPLLADRGRDHGRQGGPLRLVVRRDCLRALGQPVGQLLGPVGQLVAAVGQLHHAGGERLRTGRGLVHARKPS